MTNEDLIKEIPHLPNEIKLRIVRMIDAFRKEADGTVNDRAKKVPLREEPFVGMWADREDMADAVEWVRNIRRTQWDRSHKWKE